MPRLATWLHNYLGAQQGRYTELVGTFWAVGAVARVFDPGCKVDTIMVLEGAQGRGKSQSLRALGGEWFSDTQIDLGSKDRYQQIQGAWIYEVSELAGLDKHDAATVKGFVSSQSDRFRAPYERAVRDVPRQVAFCGSVNPDPDRGYLTDATGNRRFWPVACFETRERADLNSLYADRGQLWAEAVHLFRGGAKWYAESGDDQTVLDGEGAKRSTTNDADVWDETIGEWICETHAGAKVETVPATETDTTKTRTVPLTATHILDLALKIPAERRSRNHQDRVGRCMRRMGWRISPKTRSIGGAKCKPYERDLSDKAAEEWRMTLASVPKVRDEAKRREIYAVLYASRLTDDSVATCATRLKEIIESQG